MLVPGGLLDLKSSWVDKAIGGFLLVGVSMREKILLMPRDYVGPPKLNFLESNLL